MLRTLLSSPRCGYRLENQHPLSPTMDPYRSTGFSSSHAGASLFPLGSRRSVSPPAPSLRVQGFWPETRDGPPVPLSTWSIERRRTPLRHSLCAVAVFGHVWSSSKTHARLALGDLSETWTWTSGTVVYVEASLARTSPTTCRVYIASSFYLFN